MKPALKYGALITVVIAVWVLADHFLLHLSAADSNLRIITPIFFNLVQLFFLFVGISERRREIAGKMNLSDGIKRGLAISLAYALLACAFFLTLYLIVGPRLLEVESRSFGGQQPQSKVLQAAFGGLFFSAIFLGLVYSTIISLLLKGARTEG